MWEATELGPEDLTWAATNFFGGIAGQQSGVCGAVSSAAVYLGLRHCVPLANKELADRARQASREQCARLVHDFTQQNGSIICSSLTGVAFSDPVARQRFRDSGEWQRKCGGYVRSLIKMLYDLEGK